MSRRLYRPVPAKVDVGDGVIPEIVGGAAVESVREEWLVEDRWWTARPLRRRYFELTTDDGADRVVFCDLATGRWYSQAGA
jgi:hypothetical protein